VAYHRCPPFTQRGSGLISGFSVGVGVIFLKAALWCNELVAGEEGERKVRHRWAYINSVRRYTGVTAATPDAASR